MHTAMNKRVLVALSGGVDSSVCVHLLKEQGYEVGGVVLKMSPAHEDTVAAAEESAAAFGIPLIVRDMTEEFQKNVVDYFISEYCAAHTPNPCIRCNPTVKFAALAQTAEEQGYDQMATGHYAAVEKIGGYYQLKRAGCLKRDQSYMLYRLGQRELSKLIFPLNQMEKREVREIAARLGLACAQKPDSQEICFIPDNDYAGYIERVCGKMPQGEFIAPDGSVCGMHQGLLHYTVGQRKRLGIALGEPVFIKRMDAKENRIYLARAGEDVVTTVMVGDLTAVNGQPFPERFRCGVKLRSTAQPVPAEVVVSGGRAELFFDSAQRVVANGQSAVFYDGDLVLGGGIIQDDR